MACSSAARRAALPSTSKKAPELDETAIEIRETLG